MFINKYCEYKTPFYSILIFLAFSYLKFIITLHGHFKSTYEQFLTFWILDRKITLLSFKYFAPKKFYLKFFLKNRCWIFKKYTGIMHITRYFLNFPFHLIAQITLPYSILQRKLKIPFHVVAMLFPGLQWNSRNWR